ncbi:3'-5' exonuclease [Streptomyces sp. NBC_01551]|uniref:3'-5' exonuclease n=1 Tax=Streptomyces sp. NBC_01551 TaxID=2975876 RepID=UPI002250EDC3|nr:3'-5' exonuclease [Streptomyces sp. NBC_01551]MCX4529291.1 3'-5' exonuclease [Streptomyces sp. NBC_01551]
MNAVNPRPPGGQLEDDALFHNTHFVVLDFEGTTPKGAPPEPIEVAALGLKYERGRGPLPTGFSFTSLIHPPAHAPITPFDTAQTGITLRDVAQAPPAAVVLNGLDGALPEPPLLLVAHHAPTEGSILYAYRTACPRMARTRIIDTLLLAKHVAPGLPSYSLDALLDRFGIPQPAHRHRAMDDVTVTEVLLRTLLGEAASGRQISSVAHLVRVASRPPKATQPTQLELL